MEALHRIVEHVGETIVGISNDEIIVIMNDSNG
jgi:hypothetical protein